MHITLSNGDPLVANLVTTKTEDATRKEEHATVGGERRHQLGRWPRGGGEEIDITRREADFTN